jgi:hypothetical protein
MGRKIPSFKRTLEIAKKIGIAKDLAIQIVIQDQLKKEKVSMSVSIHNIKKAANE